MHKDHLKHKNTPYDVHAVIAAGGKGLRMGTEIKKQYIKIAGIPLLTRTLLQFISLKYICSIVLVVPEDDLTYCIENIIKPYGLKENDLITKVYIVSGGKERQHSVMNGLKKVHELCTSSIDSACTSSSCSSCSFYKNDKLRVTLKDELQTAIKDKPQIILKDELQTAIKDKPQIVLIHDGVRPFVEHEVINRTIDGALKYGASIPVIPVIDTLKIKDKDGFVSGIVNREHLYKVQTPQAFELNLIIEAHKNALLSNFSATDDASLVEEMGRKVFMAQGSPTNIKITTKEDLLFAEYFLSKTKLN